MLIIGIAFQYGGKHPSITARAIAERQIDNVRRFSSKMSSRARQIATLAALLQTSYAPAGGDDKPHRIAIIFRFHAFLFP